MLSERVEINPNHSSNWHSWSIDGRTCLIYIVSQKFTRQDILRTVLKPGCYNSGFITILTTSTKPIEHRNRAWEHQLGVFQLSIAPLFDSSVEHIELNAHQDAKL